MTHRIGIGQKEHGDRPVPGIEPGALERRVDDTDELHPRGFEGESDGAEDDEMASAKGTVEPAEQPEQHGLLTTVVGKRYGSLSVDRRERQHRGGVAHLDQSLVHG